MDAKNTVKVCTVSEKDVPLHSQIRNEAQANIKHRGVEQLVARQAHNLEVACSSPASATNERQLAEIRQVAFVFLHV